jgi:hypothetical protein
MGCCDGVEGFKKCFKYKIYERFMFIEVYGKDFRFMEEAAQAAWRRLGGRDNATGNPIRRAQFTHDPLVCWKVFPNPTYYPSP